MIILHVKINFNEIKKTTKLYQYKLFNKNNPFKKIFDVNFC